MQKTMKKIVTGTILILLVIISGIGTIVLFPQPLFANKLEYKNFKVYSNQEIDEKIKATLDNALSLVKESELHDPAYEYDVFISYNTFYNNIDDKVLGRGPAARATDNNLVIKVKIDVEKNLFFPTFYQSCEGNLTSLIAHEMIHCLQTHKYGKLKFSPFHHPELWKLEGYPEYISRQVKLQAPGYDLTREIERYIELKSKATDIWISVEEAGCKVPDYYYKSRLMTEYLIDIKGYTYDQTLRDTTSEDSIYQEMIKWKDNHKKGS
jgi:hypothetical protein